MNEHFFEWLDSNQQSRIGRFINQLIPLTVCVSMFVLFMGMSHTFISSFINPFSAEKIQLKLFPVDIFVGFFLYFVTAIDYALVVGRMQISNPGSKPRIIMNIFTCLGCFFGVSFVLFLWGFAKEIALLIIPILLFAGSMMIKLAYHGIDYFKDSPTIPHAIRWLTVKVLLILQYLTQMFTFWIPELGSPKVQKMSFGSLAKWSFFLPFIIGLDDLVGYMGAMTIYNVFSLLFGIYLADIVIDLLIFISPNLTKRIVQHALLSLFAAYAFIYLGYKSVSESYHLMLEALHLPPFIVWGIFCVILVAGAVFSHLYNQRPQKHVQLPSTLD